MEKDIGMVSKEEFEKEMIRRGYRVVRFVTHECCTICGGSLEGKRKYLKQKSWCERCAKERLQSNRVRRNELRSNGWR